MRSTHVKPPNTNTLTIMKLKRGYTALLSLHKLQEGPTMALHVQSLEEVLRAWEEVKYLQSQVCTWQWCWVASWSRKLNQNTGIPGTREVKPCNLPLKESAMTSETHWSKLALPPHPGPLNLPCLPHPYPLQTCSFRRALPLPQILIFFLMTRCSGTGFNSVITKR